jgi:type II secretory ATPase GspE/PulE/Tfp pilus assembly ATPase PilB-like protein
MTRARASGTHRGWDEIVLVVLGDVAPAATVARLRAAGPPIWDAAEAAGLCDATFVARLARRAAVERAAEPDLSVARDLMPEAVARRFRVVPLADVGGSIDVAVSDPFDFDCERALGFATGRALRLRLASPATIRRWQDEVYRDAPDALQRIVDGLGATHEVHAWAEEADDLADSALLARRADEQPVIRLADHILAEGIAQRASDIHVEADEGGYAVRYRIDGVLRHALAVPRGAGIPLVSRLKIVAGIDIADRLRPQDGRARVSVDGARVDLRVSTLPAALGEKVVIRILDARGGVRPLSGLGFTPAEAERFVSLLDARDGLILVTGPTGSGKTTTLYSALTAVRERGVNVVTVEDPVEYRIGGVSQVQVNERAGLTFATALRAILRQDPDVVFVGEIRDAETAAIAVQAALTGHLVFSTLHTVDAAGAVARLVDVGVEPYKVAAALRGVVAQRLVRRRCTSCRDSSVRTARCDACGGSGFRGRVAVTEVLRCIPAVAAAVAAGAPAVAREAERDGMRAMWWSGVAHVEAGETTLDELRRVCEPPHFAARASADGPPARRVAELLPSAAVRGRQRRAGAARRSADPLAPPPPPVPPP